MDKENTGVRIVYEASDAAYLPNFRFDNGRERDESAWNALKEFVTENRELLSAEISDPTSYQIGLHYAFALTRLFLSDFVQEI